MNGAKRSADQEPGPLSGLSLSLFSLLLDIHKSAVPPRSRMKKPAPKTTLVRCFFIQYRNLSAALSVFFCSSCGSVSIFSVSIFCSLALFLLLAPAFSGSRRISSYRYPDILFSLLPPVFLPARRTVPPHFSPAFPPVARASRHRIPSFFHRSPPIHSTFSTR